MQRKEKIDEAERKKSLEQQRSYLEMLVYLSAGRDMSVGDYLATLAVEEEKRKRAHDMPAGGWFRVNRYRPISGSAGIFLSFPIKTVVVEGGYCHGPETMKVACRAILTKGWYHPRDDAAERYPLVEHIEFKPEIQDDGGLYVSGQIKELSEEALCQAYDFAVSLLVPAVQKVDDYKRIQGQLDREKK